MSANGNESCKCGKPMLAGHGSCYECAMKSARRRKDARQHEVAGRFPRKRAAGGPAASVAEPVAWIHPSSLAALNDGSVVSVSSDQRRHDDVPLYASPPEGAGEVLADARRYRAVMRMLNEPGAAEEDAEVERNAARYAVLRADMTGKNPPCVFNGNTYRDPKDLDAAIDAALSESGKPDQGGKR